MKKYVWFVAAVALLVGISGAAFASNADFMITLAGQTTPLTAQTLNPGQTLAVDVWIHSDDTVNGASGAQIFFAFDSTNSNNINVGSTEANAINQILTMVGTNNKTLKPTIEDPNWVASGAGGSFNLYGYFSAAQAASGPYAFGNFCSMQYATGPTGMDLSGDENTPSGTYWTDEAEYTLTAKNTGNQTIGLWSFGATAPERTSSVTQANGGGQFYPGGASNPGLVDAVSITVANPAPVPEPSSLIAIGTGLFSLAGFVIRRRK
jgi:hypothetical protein